MNPYTVTYLAADGAVENREYRWFHHDDQALDEVGRRQRPQAVEIYQGGRLVAKLPPSRTR